MEIRWMYSIQLVLLLALVTIPIIRASSQEQKQYESLENSPSASPSNKWDSSLRVESDTHPDSGHFRLVDDELIGARAASEPSPSPSSSSSSSFTYNTQPKKRLLGKESKKYRKKYVSEDDYRKSMPHADDQQSAAAAGEKQTAGTAAKSSEPHSRKKRLIWVTDDGR
uniref:Uncharacterized protein n=1 Tax=Anopheles maculatus TaxID=74869 RepID=A0A182SSB8_9DIPT